MGRMDEARALDKLAYVEEQTITYTNDMACAAIARAAVRRESCELILDHGISLARVIKVNGVTRKTMNDWLDAEKLARTQALLLIDPDK